MSLMIVCVTEPQYLFTFCHLLCVFQLPDLFLVLYISIWTNRFR